MTQLISNEGVCRTAPAKSLLIIVLNRKNERHQAPIVRVVAATGLHGDQGDDQAPTLAYMGRVEEARERREGR